jgi:quinol monooxygenase YgiN
LPIVPDDVELTMVTLRLDAADETAAGTLLGVLAKYVVVARGHEGCRNIDLVTSVTHPGRYLLVQKWDSPEAQRAHFDSPAMVEMAEACRGLLANAPDVDLWDGMSAHDLA